MRAFAVLCLFLLAQTCNAVSVPAVEIPPNNVIGTGMSAGTSGTFGWNFVPTTDLFVTGLGVWTISDSKQVGLWESKPGGSLLASATIEITDTVIERHRYSSIDPVTLFNGVEYVVGVYRERGDKVGDNDTPYTSIPSISVIRAMLTGRDDLNRPDSFSASSTGIYAGPNLLVEAVPIPAAAYLFGSGILGLIAIVRRRNIA